jgi:hypothetical protein
MVAEAVEGVWYVLVRSTGSVGRLVTVTRIWDAAADTGAGDVKFAAVAVTCQALGMELDQPPGGSARHTARLAFTGRLRAASDLQPLISSDNLEVL